jgi:hypothetical protein
MDDHASAASREHFFVASTLFSQTLLVYDYFCTLDREIELIWSKPLSFPGSLLFLINRYLPVGDIIIMNLLYEINYRTYSSEQCRAHIRLTGWLMFTGMLVSEVILTIRTAALWNIQKVTVFLLVGCMFALFTVPAILFMHIEMNSLEFTPPGSFEPCSIVGSKNTVFIVFGILALYEFVIALFTAIKAYQHVRSTRSRWVIQLYGEGLSFYVYMLALSIINAVVSQRMSILEIGLTLQIFQRVFHSILCNRVLFVIFRGPTSTGERTENPTFTSLDDGRQLSGAMEDVVSLETFPPGPPSGTSMECLPSDLILGQEV